MTAAVDAPASQATGYRHEAFFWHGTEAFLARTVPFVTEALAVGHPVMIALIPEQWAPLRAALGTSADQVRYVDMAVVGRNPARLIPAWREFIASHPGSPLRGIGAPIWAGRRDAELTECQIHEELLNLAVPADVSLWLLCPYDTETLEAAVVDEAERSHPAVMRDDGSAPSLAYDDADGDRALTGRPLTPAQGAVEEQVFSSGDLAALRALAVAQAERAGLSSNQAQDLALAVSELASNSVDHGGGTGLLRIWTDPGALVIEVTDSGRVLDPLAGRRTPTPHQSRGRGLWMVNRLCDLVQIRSVPGEGTVVRVVSWL